MNVWDVVILLAVGALVVFAWRQLRRGKTGGCGGCCDCCSQACAEKQPKEPACSKSGK